MFGQNTTEGHIPILNPQKILELISVHQLPGAEHFFNNSVKSEKSISDSHRRAHSTPILDGPSLAKSLTDRVLAFAVSMLHEVVDAPNLM
jgi:hypothetical protein